MGARTVPKGRIAGGERGWLGCPEGGPQPMDKKGFEERKKKVVKNRKEEQGKANNNSIYNNVKGMQCYKIC